MFSFLLVCASMNLNAQTFFSEENDTTVMSEYNDGLQWAYRQIGDFVVGMTNYVVKDEYGKNYQIQIFIKNLGDTPVTFDPEEITSILYNKYDKEEEMKVYSYDAYMRKVRNQQNLVMAFNGIYTYNYAAAAAANIASTTQMMLLSKMMKEDKNTISQGYLKITTIHPDEGIIGYMNIKSKSGKVMTVNIPVGEYVYSFDWDIEQHKGKTPSHVSSARLKHTR